MCATQRPLTRSRLSLSPILSATIYLTVIGCGADDNAMIDSGAVDDSGARDSTVVEDAMTDSGGRDAMPLLDAGFDSSTSPVDSSVPAVDSGPAPAGLLFADNFDALPDWDFSGRCLWLGDDDPSCAQLPGEWDLVYGSGRNPTTPTCQILSAGARGASGKGLRFTDESTGARSQWGADCQLYKYLGAQHEELWFSFWIHWNPDMNLTDFNVAKIFRAGYYPESVIESAMDPRGGSRVTSNTSSSLNAMVFIDIDGGSSVDSRWSIKAVYRCNPDYKACVTNADRGDLDAVDSTFASTIGDGAWHRIMFHMRMNSGAGVGDGVFEAYWDDRRVIERTNMDWRLRGATDFRGFNLFSVLGNQEHTWACSGRAFCEDSSEMWKYDIDDVKVGTTEESVR
ncbi:MAG: hypothetical protein GXP55_08675 [Deltaproteobacteria bacterium]|nr:hypothetical protein [Deltaproteobacteria bacterium]